MGGLCEKLVNAGNRDCEANGHQSKAARGIKGVECNQEWQRIPQPFRPGAFEIDSLRLNDGGPGRDRTDDLFHAMEARSQLRHRPTLRKVTFYSRLRRGLRSIE